MAALGVVLDDVFQALSKASANASGGLVERGEQGFVIRSVGTFQQRRARRHRPRLPASRLTTAGVPVTIKDVAQRRGRLRAAPGRGHARQANLDAVQGIVLMRKGQNPSIVLEGIRAKVAELAEARAARRA